MDVFRQSGKLLAIATLSMGVALDATANSADELWFDVDANEITRTTAHTQPASTYRSVRMNRTALLEALNWAPRETEVRLENSQTEISLPLADGSYGRFRVVESPIMAPALASRYPQIKTWLGQGVDDPSATVRMDLTPKGFHAQIISWRGTELVDPFQPGDNEHYVAYSKRDALARGERPRCLVTGAELPVDMPDFSKKGIRAKIASGENLRTHRLAMAATGEYTTVHGGTVLDGLAAIVTTMNRVNGIYERELSVRMELIANNDQIIYTDGSTDPYTNNSGSTMLGQNQSNLNAVIGSANYDVGHVVSTGGGGVASLGVICSGSKARGVTGLGNPIGDVFDVDFVAHEIGHQYAGSHTFNGGGGNCSGGNRSPNQAYEPGSGVTIQAYAGICGGDNLQSNSEDNFHRVSLNQMIAHTTTGSGSNCGTLTTTGNTPPTVTTSPAFNIPQLTPFELTAVGDDADGDSISYSWEQFDLGDRNATGNLVDDGSRPLFRVFAPNASPSRIFPSLRFILNNANSPPASAPLPGTGSNVFTGEILPSTNRALNFRVTVRDNRAGGGGTNEAATVLTVTTAAGPFAVTAPNTVVDWAAGTMQTVSWDVANTDVAPISTANVRISLSLDGGLSWPIDLSASTANDGTEMLTIPANTPASTQARIRVAAVDNVYFDISDSNFSITGTNSAPTINVQNSITTRQGSPTVVSAVGTATDIQDAAGSLSVTTQGAPTELEIVASNDNGDISLSVTAACTLVAPTSGTKVYPVQVIVTDSEGASGTAQAVINVGSNQVPTLGNYATAAVGPNGTVMVTPTAPATDPNNNLLSTTVSPSTLPGGGTVSVNLAGVVSIMATPGTTLGDYPINVTTTDSCGGTEKRQFTLSVTDTLFEDGFE